MAKLADAADLKSYITLANINHLIAIKQLIDIISVRDILTHVFHTFAFLKDCGGHPRWRNNTTSWAARFMSTNARTAVTGSAPAISPARIAGRAQRKTAFLKRKRSPRIGICSCAENSAAEKSKQKKPSAKHRNYSFVNTTSSRRASAAKSMWKANSGARRGTWCRSSVLWACRKLLPARSRTTAFI